MDSDRDTEECPICLDPIAAEVKLKTHCNHTFCTYCLLKTSGDGCYWKCPICRQNISVSTISASDGKSIAKVACTCNTTPWRATPDVLNVLNILKECKKSTVSAFFLGGNICVTCGESPATPLFPACKHVQCKLCLLLIISNNEHIYNGYFWKCPICKGKLSLRTTVNINGITMDPAPTPVRQTGSYQLSSTLFFVCFFTLFFSIFLIFIFK